MLRIYQYAVIKQQKLDKDGDVIEEGELIVPITSVLAKDEGQAQLLASRAIPDDEIGNLDRLVVVVTPF